MPDHFVIIGAQRSGTTYLYRLLDEHPEIEMAKPMYPEPKFFLDDALYARGPRYYEAEFFSEPETRVRGEKSTSYIEYEVAARRMRETFPEAVAVVVLRDPVRRAVSNYRFTSQHGHEDMPLAEALRASASGERTWDRARFSVSPFAYLERGRYVDYLETWARHLPPEQIHVVFFEEMVADGFGLEALFRRLGVDPLYRPAVLGSVVNASDDTQDAIDAGTEALMRDYFREPNRRLSGFLGRELPWPA